MSEPTIDPLDLILVVEESAELIQAICKALRFGLHGRHPDYAKGMSKYEAIISEIGDLQAVIDRLEIFPGLLAIARAAKHARLEQWGPDGTAGHGRGML